MRPVNRSTAGRGCGRGVRDHRNGFAPIDAELVDALRDLHRTPPPGLTPKDIPRLRAALRRTSKPLSEIIGSRPISADDHEVPSSGACPAIVVTVLRGTHGSTGRPCIVYLHGGGMIMGDRFAGAHELCSWVERLDAVIVTVEYRLAPEHPRPAPLEDCYAAPRWVVDHATDLGNDPSRIVTAGTSAGGGLAAGVTLLWRDRGGSALAGQLLVCPMLDHRDDTPAFIDVGSAETFRDEGVAYASALWRAGVQAELHVWPGAFHGSDSFVPKARLSRLARQARVNWLQRMLAGS